MLLPTKQKRHKFKYLVKLQFNNPKHETINSWQKCYMHFFNLQNKLILLNYIHVLYYKISE